MIELSLPRSPRFLINTLVLAMILFGLYYRPLPYNVGASQPLHQKLTDAYYAAFWQEALPIASSEGIALQTLWPLYVSNLVEREIVVSVTNNTTSTINAIVVVTALKDFRSENAQASQQWLIWQSESQTSSNGYGGRSVLTLGDIPPRGQVTESLWVKVSPVGQSPESVFFRTYVYWTYPENPDLTCASPQSSPPCELIGSTAPRTFVDATRTVWQGIVKALLLPPLNNLLLPLLALFLALSYEGVLAMISIQWQNRRKMPAIVQTVLSIVGKFLYSPIRKIVSRIKANKWLGSARELIARFKNYVGGNQYYNSVWGQKIRWFSQGVASLVLLPVIIVWWLAVAIWNWSRNNIIYFLGSIFLYFYGALLLWEIVTLATYLLAQDINLLPYISRWPVIVLILISLLVLIYAQGQLANKELELAFSDKGLQDIKHLMNEWEMLEQVAHPLNEMQNENAGDDDAEQPSISECELEQELREIRQKVENMYVNQQFKLTFDGQIDDIKKSLKAKVNNQTYGQLKNKVERLEELVEFSVAHGRVLQTVSNHIDYFEGLKNTYPTAEPVKTESSNDQKWTELKGYFENYSEIGLIYGERYSELQTWWGQDNEQSV